MWICNNRVGYMGIRRCCVLNRRVGVGSHVPRDIHREYNTKVSHDEILREKASTSRVVRQTCGCLGVSLL